MLTAKGNGSSRKSRGKLREALEESDVTVYDYADRAVAGPAPRGELPPCFYLFFRTVTAS